MAKNSLKNPGGAMEIVVNVGISFASRSPKAALSSLPEVFNFCNTDRSLYLGLFVWFYADWMKQRTDRLYPSAPFENNDLDQQMEKK